MHKSNRKVISDLCRELDTLEITTNANRRLRDEAVQSVSDHEEALALLQSVTAKLQNKAQEKVATIVTRCLELVFDDPYAFKIVFEEKRGKTEARLVFERDGMEINPLLAAGGGVIDVASFALRLAALVLAKPSVRKLLILDEPFKHVSKKYRPDVRELLLRLAEEYKVQIIMVTHDPVLTIGEVVELT